MTTSLAPQPSPLAHALGLTEISRTADTLAEIERRAAPRAAAVGLVLLGAAGLAFRWAIR